MEGKSRRRKDYEKQNKEKKRVNRKDARKILVGVERGGRDLPLPPRQGNGAPDRSALSSVIHRLRNG